MSRFKRLKSDKVFTTMTYVTVALLSHFLVFPLAAMSHNAILMGLAYITPLVVGTIMRSKNLIDLPPSNLRQRIFILGGLALVGFLFWHQMTLVAVIAFLMVFFTNTKIQSATN